MLQGHLGIRGPPCACGVACVAATASTWGGSSPVPWSAQAIREMGGHTKAAQTLNMETIRRPRGHWWDLGRVVAELQDYLHGRPDIREQRRLPTHK